MVLLCFHTASPEIVKQFFQINFSLICDGIPFVCRNERDFYFPDEGPFPFAAGYKVPVLF